MQSTLAIASVTAVLKNVLENGLVDSGVTTGIGGDVLVSALPPDRIVTGADERAQINLFLYQVIPNTGLRRLDRTEATRSAPALALDLGYLLTAYGSLDFQIEILLGYIFQLFQKLHTLDHEMIRQSLDAVSSTRDGRVVPPPVAALAASRLSQQVEQIKLTPQFLSTEEMSKLWSALQSRYRPSVAYKVSVVLIEQ